MARYILGKKQTARNEDFADVWKSIGDFLSFEEADALVNEAADYVRRVTAGKRVGYGWSGGKDSLALQVVMERAGEYPSVLCVASELEYPRLLAWYRAHAPKGCRILDNPKLTMSWLAEHQGLMFPADSDITDGWYGRVQRAGWKRFYDEAQLDILCLGKRLADGNFVGKNGQDVYRSANGCNLFNPIARWKHEDVMAVVHYFKGGQLPEFYYQKDGFVKGTGLWCVRDKSWQEVYDTDPSVVESAAHYFASAAEFLRTKEQ